MSEQYITGLPGVRTARTASHRIVFKQRSEMFLAGGRQISGANSRDPGNTGDIDILRPGITMGKLTTGGLWAPSAYGVTTNAEASGSVAVEFTTAVGTEIVRRKGATGTFKLIGPAVAGGPVQVETVTYSAIAAGVATVTAIANAFVAGSIVAPVDGAEYPQAFLPDGWGMQTTDTDHTTSLDVEFPQLPVSGIVVASQLLPWPADASLRQWVLGQLSTQGMGKFVFDLNY